MKPGGMRRDWLLVVLVLAIGGAAVCFFAKPNPPARWKGQNAWQWTIQALSPVATTRDAGTAELQAMGTNAVPLLLHRLRDNGSLLTQIRVWLGAHLPGKMGRAFTRTLKRQDYGDIHSVAARGLKLLGPVAAPAVPALLKAMHEPGPQVILDSASALGKTGPVAVPGLIAKLTDQDYRVRHAAAYALGEIARDATLQGTNQPALPATLSLVRCLLDGNENVRSAAGYAVAQMGRPAGPVILKFMQESHGDLRRAAAQALVPIHPPGRLTLPVLVELAHDSDPTNRVVAIQCMMHLSLSHSNALAVYIAGLEDPNLKVRLASVHALESVSAKAGAASDKLTTLRQSDPEAAVRDAAEAALKTIWGLSTPGEGTIR